MKKIAAVLMTAGCILGFGGMAMAAENDSQTVTYTIPTINELAVTGTPTLTIAIPDAGSQPTPVEATANYAITTNESNKIITAALELGMPDGTALAVTLAAPGEGQGSQGKVALSTTSQNVVTGISKLADDTNSITYELTATAEADAATSTTSPSVIFTIIDGEV
ncbi:hypothetical protein [Desulfococcus multivorans]|uniref:Uncharacterized protein n=1 Tax=Desulfococcus multivorans DSM 2059 TaxID=1121405 RepID=S7TVG1_DESML|nr:hypothetical protein [Desulfococcus multivorans]AOY60437.1 conserved uncharacterized protein [Desulfococcus multivorans]AQV02529.1 hypothetical protein B2D07_18315 [Desulfococcus multivorans]EPR41062.1 hypothetical protein dsmv_2284 [Desulfococcus multivorans DSM 2059]SJZ61568.1 hypothetical protein SAMN02745446_01134 [Desulfococcus multivorans DSM 2059]